MTRRTVPLTVDRLALLDDGVLPCAGCVRWELDAVRHARVASDGDAVRATKQEWLSTVLREWGSCGRVVLVDDEPVGLACYAPPAFYPGAAAHPTAPVSADAVLLAALHVAPAHRGGGLARLLVQGVVRDLVTRGGVRALEAFATTRTPARGGCLLPQELLARVGFRTHRAHPTTPRMRMEVRSVSVWRDEVEAALERLVDAVRPGVPAPSVNRSQPVKASRSFSSAALGLAPTMDFTTSPPW
ncbi:GNAT family N-acetyltransferase [Nocardioides marinquilinus]|uniref:GNAT family N-acetyltransferase n=1 Tax=Nocardioides marinquilinus TaxID=1210400 RepID=A0ABP9P5A6_9ACTN